MLCELISKKHGNPYNTNYSGTPMAQTSLGPTKFVLDMGSSRHRELIIVPDQETNGNNVGMSFPSSVK